MDQSSPVLERRLLNEQLEAIFNSSFDGIWVCDGDGTILHYNPAAERMINAKLVEYQGKKVDCLVEDKIIDRTVTREVLEQKRKVTIIQVAPKTGKKYLVTGNPTFDAAGNVKMVVANCRDLTRLDQLRRELLENKARTDRFEGELRRYELNEIASHLPVGRSAVMQQVLRTAAHVAQFNATVLITGESGVGKGMLASMIHRISEVREKPFISVDCGAIPESLFESEIFGYMPGAFTGASRNGKIGLFEMADGGTLFLDYAAGEGEAVCGWRPRPKTGFPTCGSRKHLRPGPMSWSRLVPIAYLCWKTAAKQLIWLIR